MTAASHPFVISFEGPNAAGKTTLARLLCDRLGVTLTLSVPLELSDFRRDIDELLSPEEGFAFYRVCNAVSDARIAVARPSIVVRDRSALSTAAYHATRLGRDVIDVWKVAVSSPSTIVPNLALPN